jgi:hypothetical protein
MPANGVRRCVAGAVLDAAMNKKQPADAYERAVEWHKWELSRLANGLKSGDLTAKRVARERREHDNALLRLELERHK